MTGRTMRNFSDSVSVVCAAEYVLRSAYYSRYITTAHLCVHSSKGKEGEKEAILHLFHEILELKPK
jgi:hypothetical protein